MKKKENKKLRAFTLIEIIVTISIVSMIAVVSITAVGVGRSKNNIKTARREVASVINLVHSYALQGKVVNSSETPCGFGFVFSDDDSYRLFYIPAESGKSCDEKNNDSYYRRYIDEDSSPTLEEFDLKNGVTLDPNVSPQNTGIYFSIPHANVYNSSGNSLNSLTITLITASSSDTGIINVQANGSLTEE